MSGSSTRGAQVVVELVRLVTVVLLVAAGSTLGPDLASFIETEVETGRLLSSLLGASLGYLLGGLLGRLVVRGVEQAEETLQRIDAAVLVSALIGATVATLFAMAMLWPVLLLPGKLYAIPAAAVVLIALTYAGGRIGAARGGDLLRYLGARGRVEVTTPSRGGGAKLIDTSALIDGRLVPVARAGFLEGTLVIPQFVLGELQALADVEDPRRRGAGRRGLDTLRVLQEDGVVTVEVTDDDVPEMSEIDGKLVAIARERKSSLVTVDANLALVAEVSGIRVLSLHVLAEALRPPVIPGDRVTLHVMRSGREAGQGVGYLPDGTMVVIERAAGVVGRHAVTEINSITQTRNGRMLFGSFVEETTPVPPPAELPRRAGAASG